ncbi:MULTISPECIES: carboxymuconolactone decarboxylase family protein [Rhodococcus]|jgi:alkylhydroperoxidase family enzyme|uniref:Carboxymuconolactone decarboxylase family protein n=1 Tax=Rhodococcus aetherivorans TaxID=191292 RepID=N1M7J0_9NOCA|nr:MULTISPECIES: carboxymuconolactone decarboxylase family protein [Rhodococcus]ETT27201.1 Carboxymuconolactone decarboxylase [Rhodococcus rhodochrous ATCC 21198]AKE91425.1 carboxymuconolactone decarboxylase [Rhodococcus aetherivorans]ANZ23743.1 carboxymuconolactone decarboxylase [Rhodococcus sp. WB1]KDE11821.1 carboxymuconolactone decarboxylase [Rhodococcus aetherivorans]MBC2589188.1 carboxymuconolactone decarboxylase family protein [Rhodococcus aetherivorans]
MPRLREVPRAEVTDEKILFFYDRLFGADKDPAVDHGTIHATPGDWWTVFAQSPAVFRHAVRGFALYRNAGLDPLLRELGQGRAGYARGSQFVFSQHCKQMRSLGMSEEKIAALPHWQISDRFSELERAVLAYTDGLVLGGGRVPDEVFALLRAHLSDQEIMELTYITCMYDMHATICRALKLEFDDRPEPVEEVRIPDGVHVSDLSADLAGE